MTQIITGPFGRLVYHDARPATMRQYPTLNLPCVGFAGAAGCVARNDNAAPLITDLSRETRHSTDHTLSASPGRRKS